MSETGSKPFRKRISKIVFFGRDMIWRNEIRFSPAILPRQKAGHPQKAG